MNISILNIKKCIFTTILIVSLVFLTACGGSGSVKSGEKVREPLGIEPYIPVAAGTSVASSGVASIDYSNASKGYVMVDYSGGHSGKVKLQITTPSGEVYSYDLNEGAGYETFPLSKGNGNYTLQIYEQASGNEYYLVDSANVWAELENDRVPFLYSNQYVNFTKDSLTSIEAQELYAYTGTDLEFIEAVFDYTMELIEYDTEKANQAASGSISGYLPNLNETVETEKGICFDYAAVMVAMLRSQGLPSKLQIGYSGEVYHAWISVYTEETGWIDDVISFDGNAWALMDPTFQDNSGGSMKDYIGDAENYVEKFVY